jgi:hypothetical protein
MKSLKEMSYSEIREKFGDKFNKVKDDTPVGYYSPGCYHIGKGVLVSESRFKELFPTI